MLVLNSREERNLFVGPSVLTFHDAIELFLELASEYLGVPRRLKELRFMEYWNLLNPILKKKGKNELTQKIVMDKLNGTRIAFKHHGTSPSKSAIKDSEINSTNFFEENTLIVFGIKFSDISLIELVQCDDAKNSLIKSQEMLRADKIENALDNSALAFAQLIDDYENRKRDEFGRSPFFFGEKMPFMGGFHMDIGGDLGDFVDDVSKSVKALQNAVEILSLGLDYRKYVKFRLLTPVILRINGGKYKIHRIGRGSKGAPTAEDVQFCIDFVIESAIVLQEFDFEVKQMKRRSLKDLM